MDSRSDMLEDLYRGLNRREYVHPDPLEFLYRYDDPADREVVALLASSLAFGQVGQILRSVEAVLDRLGPRPARFLVDTSPGQITKQLRGFKYRFVRSENVAALLIALRQTIKKLGSIEAGFARGIRPGDQAAAPAALAFLGLLIDTSGNKCGYLLPSPTGSSACKRLMLMLRWLVRADAVDPGGWGCIDPAWLVVPLDTHMHRLGLAMGLTGRKSADMKTALEITAGFRQLAPADPAKYDFALTRLGIRKDMNAEKFLANWTATMNG